MKRELKVFGYLFKVQFMYWRENIMNLFLGLGVSLYTMVCWLAFKTNDPFLMISGLCVGMVRNSMYIHLKASGDFKANGLYNRYDVAPINPATRFLAMLAFNLFSTAAIVLFMFIIALIFFPAQRTYLQHSNQGIVWAGLFLTWVTSIIVCYFIIAFVKARYVGQMIGLFLYFSTMYFLGLGFPFSAVISADWLNWILYFHPFRYVMNITQAGFINGGSWIFTANIMDDIHWVGASTPEQIASAQAAMKQGMSLFTPIVPNPNFYSTQITPEQNTFEVLNMGYNQMTWLPFVLAIIVMLVYGIATYAKTYWSLSFHKRDKYGKFAVNKSSSRYLHHIKDAQSISELVALHKQRLRILQEDNPSITPTIKQVEREMRVEEIFKLRRKKKKLEEQKADK